MRRASALFILALSAGRAWAQPAPAEKPAEPAPGEQPPTTTPTDAPTVPAAPVPAEPERPTAQPPEAAPVAAPEKAVPVAWSEVDDRPNRDAGFRFGSYGRVLAGSDLRGGKPEKVAIVAHAPRIVEPSYVELELSYGFDKLKGTHRQIVLRPIVTLALDGTLFHDTGEFDAHPALRNMFLDARLGRDLTAWVGSRMYRGDDIYLFDYWPLDDQNTVGAGINYRPVLPFRAAGGDGPGDVFDLAAHVGFNRLLDDFQFQQLAVANPVQGATTVDQLNRQRTVASATAGYTMMPKSGGIGAKVKLHGEYHTLPSGTRKRMDGTLEELPADTGLLVGAELGVFGFDKDPEHRNHLNFFMRYAKGLAAFDELAPPTTFGPELKTQRANELTFGLSGNIDLPYGNMMVGALSRRFIDADESSDDADDGWEYAVDARPLFRVVPDWFVGADVSYQARFPKGINPITLTAEDASVFQIAPMLVFSPMGPSSYDRPQIRVFYRGAHLDQGALDLYVPDDPRHSREWVHFLGFAAEWWFNSSTYH